MPVTWVKIESWHVLRNGDRTQCGLAVSDEDELFASLPPGFWQAKSCETCLRIISVAQKEWEAAVPS